MIKILLSYNNFDMQPFFKWEFKVLPLVISDPGSSRRYTNLLERHASIICRKELDDIKAAGLQFKEEKRRMELLLERKRSIIDRLGLAAAKEGWG